MNKSFPTEVQMISIKQVEVLNPRSRNPKGFRKIVENIAAVGLKKPITVSPIINTEPQRYYLVCGQGRMEAFMELDQEEIPAFVVEATEHECLIMSLVENIARRQQKPMELLKSVTDLKARGYSNVEIGKKIDLHGSYVGDVVKLIKNGEEGLIRAVESGKVPISVATEIASVGQKEAMVALQQAYEAGQIKGPQLLKAKRLISLRGAWGKKIMPPRTKKKQGKITGNTLVRTLKQEADRQRSMVREYQRTRRQILFVESAMKRLRGDLGFVNLLRAVGLETMPEIMDERVG
jgi:ParB family transcriptional regulator, chromosome partitioning protein